ncbi:hypothetical protein [Kribbella sp. CA-247076]|uniref:hypothetical protein n=1 Tax=Kribbella sp. CA-247076 TaxID=3239941 RepID=UPI003D8EA1C7
MNEGEFADWIQELVDEGVYSAELGRDFVDQRSLFEELFRLRILAGDPELPGAVGCVADEPIGAPSPNELVAAASERHEGRAIYFESVMTRIR